MLRVSKVHAFCPDLQCLIACFSPKPSPVHSVMVQKRCVLGTSDAYLLVLAIYYSRLDRFFSALELCIHDPTTPLCLRCHNDRMHRPLRVYVPLVCDRWPRVGVPCEAQSVRAFANLFNERPYWAIRVERFRIGSTSATLLTLPFPPIPRPHTSSALEQVRKRQPSCDTSWQAPRTYIVTCLIRIRTTE